MPLLADSQPARSGLPMNLDGRFLRALYIDQRRPSAASLSLALPRPNTLRHTRVMRLCCYGNQLGRRHTGRQTATVIRPRHARRQMARQAYEPIRQTDTHAGEADKQMRSQTARQTNRLACANGNRQGSRLRGAVGPGAGNTFTSLASATSSVVTRLG